MRVLVLIAIAGCGDNYDGLLRPPEPKEGMQLAMQVTVQPRHLTVFPLDGKSGEPDVTRRRVVHPRYGQAALARWR